ncbi:MAG: type II toxin-antitoxin system YafQ family toxin [Treponema sp.]|jgi:mRNA interferase YafQ|nr:type II toxin-antitoxin system YafQ family toxin [Treponema sp.]
MLKHTFTKPFRKELKLMEKRGLNLSKLREVIDMIIDEQPLPPERHNHPLHGKWEGSFDCHIHGDWVLIYKLNHTARTVTFQRTGTHSDLF